MAEFACGEEKQWLEMVWWWGRKGKYHGKNQIVVSIIGNLKYLRFPGMKSVGIIEEIA